MATIIEKTKDGKIVSFKFRVSLGRDENKRQIIRCTTWHPDKKMSNSKNRKEAEKRASVWEQKVKQEFLFGKKEQRNRCSIQKQVTLSQFANDIWMPLAVKDGEHCNSTVEMYQYIKN